MKKLFIPILLISLILSACATATEEAPLPTLEPVLPTSTFPPPTETALPTETLAPVVEVSPTAEIQASNVSFANNVLPVLQTRCLECHGGRQTKEGFNVSTYDSVLAGSFDGAVIIPGNATDSLMVQLIAAGEMPNRGPKVTNEELQLIIDWINQGAINN